MNKNVKFVITINRELGSGGRTVGEKLAAKLGVPFYDKALIKALTEKYNLTVEEIERLKGRSHSWWADFKRVLLMPDSSKLTVGGLFQTDYWNYRMFKTISENNKKPVSPGTLGILCNPEHPLFRSFPTEMHTNWQWFPIIKSSHPFILDNTGKDYRPIVQVIDNIERNHKLGLVFEFAIGKGKLLVCMADLEKASAYPEGRQFYRSVLEYMTSKDFAPQTKISLQDFHRLMSTDVVEGKIGELNNISPY